MSDLVTGNGASSAPVDPDIVSIELPAQSRSLRLLRLAAADAAGDLGFGMDRVESARIAVDELAAVLVEAAEGDRLSVWLGRADGTLVVGGSVPTAASEPPQLDRIVSELLAVCSDRWSLEVDRGTLRFSVAISP